MAKETPEKYWRFKLDTRRSLNQLRQLIENINTNGGGGSTGDGTDVDLSAYATKVWVESKGYITGTALANYVSKDELPDLENFATKEWVKSQSYITADALIPYAKSSDLSAYLPIEGGTMEGPLTMASELLMDAHILPTETNSYNIGSSALKFRQIHANYFYGNLSGTATSATTTSRLSVGDIFPTTKYGNYAGILQTSGTTNATVPQEGVMFNILRIFRNVSTGYYTDLAQSLDGEEGLYYRRMQAGTLSEWKRVACKDDLGGYLLKDVADTTYLGIEATAADAGKLGGQLPSYYAKSDDLTALSNLFNKMFEFDSENNAIKAKLSLYSEGAITAKGVGSAGDGGTSGGGISEITSEMVVSALGYTPYNASNPSGYITVSAIPTQLSQLTDNVGYALAAAIPTALSQLTNDAYYLRGYNTTETSFTYNRTIGVYRYGSGVANKDGAPAGATDYGNLVVFRGDIADTLVQLYFNYNDDKIFVRSTNSEGIKNNTKGWQTLAYVSNIPTDNSQLNNGAGYSTKSWVNDKLVAYTPLTTVQGYDNRITGLEGALPDLQNRVTVVEQLAQGTDAALINYALKTEIPTLANGYGRGGVLHSSDIGYAEVGIALDFHRLAGDNEDYWTRLRVADTLAKNTVYLPTVNGTLAVTSQIPTLLSQLTDNVGYATQGWVEGKGYVTLAGDQTISGVKRFTASMFAAKLNFTGGTTTATLKMDGSSLSINQELKLTKGGSSDICSGIATAFKTNLAQTTNLIANKIIMGTNSGQASTLPIEFCKYTSISDSAPSGLTTLMSLDTNGNLDVKSLTIGGITLSVVNGALKIAGSMYATGAITAKAVG